MNDCKRNWLQRSFKLYVCIFVGQGWWLGICFCTQFELLVRYPCKILRMLFGTSVWNLQETFKVEIYVLGSWSLDIIWNHKTAYDQQWIRNWYGPRAEPCGISRPNERWKEKHQVVWDQDYWYRRKLKTLRYNRLTEENIVMWRR